MHWFHVVLTVATCTLSMVQTTPDFSRGCEKAGHLQHVERSVLLAGECVAIRSRLAEDGRARGKVGTRLELAALIGYLEPWRQVVTR